MTSEALKGLQDEIGHAFIDGGIPVVAPQRDDLSELLAAYGRPREASAAVVKALDYRHASPDPTKDNYVNPLVVAADRAIAEQKCREALASCPPLDSGPAPT